MADKLGCTCLHNKAAADEAWRHGTKVPRCFPPHLPLQPLHPVALRAEDSHAPDGPGAEPGVQEMGLMGLSQMEPLAPPSL